MSRTKKTILIVVVMIAAVASPFVYGLLFWGEYPTEQSATRSFTIDEDFTLVRKILVRKDGAKQIITMGGGSEFVEQKWKEIVAGTDQKEIGAAIVDLVASPNPSWELNLDGTLKVRTLDEYVGKHVVTLKQHVDIKPDVLDSRVDLVEGSERLAGYAMTTRFSRAPDDSEKESASDDQKPAGPLLQMFENATSPGKTVVELSLSQKINTQAPWFAHNVADRRVKESVEKTLENQEQAIRKFIEENRDDVPVFPLR